MQAIDVLRAEHDGVLAVLASLEQAAGAAEQGQPVPDAVFRDMREFFEVFVDRCHHGKEEAGVFPRLVQRGATELPRRLEAEHEQERGIAATFSAAVAQYRPGDAATARQLAASARAYADLLRRHIDLETRELFPAMETLAADDAALVEAFERIEEQRIGPGVHERFHTMIDELPARIAPWLRAQ